MKVRTPYQAMTSVLAAACAAAASAQPQVDRTVLPLAEPKRPTYTEIDARKVKMPRWAAACECRLTRHTGRSLSKGERQQWVVGCRPGEAGERPVTTQLPTFATCPATLSS